MPNGNPTHVNFVLTLLRTAATADGAGRWTLRELFPLSATLYIVALEFCLESDLVERVSEGCGRWHYALTAAGRNAAAAGEIPRPVTVPLPDNHPWPRGSMGFPDGHRNRGKSDFWR